MEHAAIISLPFLVRADSKQEVDGLLDQINDILRVGLEEKIADALATLDSLQSEEDFAEARKLLTQSLTFLPAQVTWIPWALEGVMP